MDILICGTKARNRAIQGDVVAVELLPRNEWKGRVSVLCENESEEKTAEETESEPMATDEDGDWFDGDLAGSGVPKYLPPLSFQIVVVMGGRHALLREMPVNTPENPWKVDTEEQAQRVDLRNTHLVFSIDPKGCEDVDDALSVRRLANDNLELGVHIADVTHFVKFNSYTDLEARSRATTCYLADRRYDMLPSILSADLCSLLGGADRYAVSVLWELDKTNYEVVKVWFGRTIIKSAYKMYYEAAQALLDGELRVMDDIPELKGREEKDKHRILNDLIWAIEKLTDIARHIRAKRALGGALELEGIELRVQLDEKKNISDLVPKQPLEVHQTVAECMILANHWVAKKITENLPHQALLRRHPPPQQEFFTELIDCAKAKGFKIDTRSNKALADSLDMAEDPDDPEVNKLLRSMATQAMSNALYFSTGSCTEDEYYHY
eukprot:g46822.t1